MSITYRSTTDPNNVPSVVGTELKKEELVALMLHGYDESLTLAILSDGELYINSSEEDSVSRSGLEVVSVEDYTD